MKQILTAFLLLWSVQANAATIAFTITATGTNATKTYTLTDAELLRIIAAYQIAANAAMNRPATRQEVLAYWIRQIIAQTAAAVQSNDQQTAVDALPPITPINPQ